MHKWLKRLGGKPERVDDDFVQIGQLLQEVIGRELGKGELTPETRLDDLGFDSIGYINLILHLEDLVDVDIEEIASRIDLTSVQTIGDAVRLLGELKGQVRQGTKPAP